MILPKVKTANIVVQTLRGETLIYDLTTDQAFCLNETAAKVYESCDGETSFAELKTKYQLTDDVIYLTLDELKAYNLLENYESTHFAGLSRREAVKKVGLASMIALPIVTGIVAPTAAHAASPTTCAAGVCVKYGQNFCTTTNCIGKTINYTIYTSRTGTCSGDVVDTADYACTVQGNNIAVGDLFINSVT